MPRPQSKEQLLELSEKNYGKLRAMIEGLSPEQRAGTFGFEDRDRNIRDVLVHLYEWHQLLLRWEAANMAGEARPFLRAGYNWKTYPQMNIEFWEEHQGTSLAQAEQMLEQSHAEVGEMITRHTDEELFTKKYYPWVGGSSLGSYCVSATSSHYDWAMKKIKKYIAELKN